MSAVEWTVFNQFHQVIQYFLLSLVGQVLQSIEGVMDWSCPPTQEWILMHKATFVSAQQLIESGLKAMSQSDLLSCKETGFLFARKTDKWSNRESILFICHFALGASYGVEFLQLFGDKLSPFWFGHEGQREHCVLAPLDNFLTCDRVKKLSSSECKKINDTFLALWVSEINSNSRVLTYYFSVPDFALTKLLMLNCSALATRCPAKPSYPRWALVDLCDLRYANDTISLHGRDCMQNAFSSFCSAAHRGVARPAHKADTVSLLCYASFDLLWMT